MSAPVQDSKGALPTEKLETHSARSPSESTDNLGNESDGYGSSEEHVFKDPAVADYWRGIYENARYENRHRFDPNFQWTPEEEKKLVRKIDLRIMLWAWIMFCALDLHRRNINRAISDNMCVSPDVGFCFELSEY